MLNHNAKHAVLIEIPPKSADPFARTTVSA